MPIDEAELPPLTRDLPAPGVIVWQPKRGYRYGVEVYALAAFALGGGPVATAIDLGCGSGVVGLLLASRGVRVTSVDREPRWVALARRNAGESDFPVDVIEADVRTWSGPRADLVVTNPPWFPANEPVSPDPWRAASRAMLHGDVRAFVEAGLRHAPRVCVVTRRERERDLVGLPLARRSRLGGEVVLIEVAEGRGPLVEEPLDLRAAYALFGR
ncbi:MAG: methyltransferase [Pseudomonadota bacterium]|nr:methyltransferase [Pseudomonadota bacterium]